MDTLFFWVGIQNIPKALENDKYIKNVDLVAGKYIYKNKKLFVVVKQVRVTVSHALNRPFHLKKTLKMWLFLL